MIGVILILVETQTPTHGIIGIIGVAALAGSGLLLFDTGDAGLEVSVPVVITVGVVLGGFVLFAAERALEARHGTGRERPRGADRPRGRGPRCRSIPSGRCSPTARSGGRGSPTASPRPTPTGRAGAALECGSSRWTG